MALVNYATREINAKIVYYGPGLSGKTTNIQFVFQRVKPKNKGRLISLSTQGDRTLFFDFLPVELGKIKGFKTRFHLYTVPGQVFYNTTRKLVLKGADGVVFVADSQKMMVEENLQSFDNLKTNLRELGIKTDTFPIILQYNKQDLDNAASVEKMNEYMNRDGLPYFAASAIKGEGVLQTLTATVKSILQSLKHGSADLINIESLEEEGAPKAEAPGTGTVSIKMREPVSKAPEFSIPEDPVPEISAPAVKAFTPKAAPVPEPERPKAALRAEETATDKISEPVPREGASAPAAPVSEDVSLTAAGKSGPEADDAFWLSNSPLADLNDDIEEKTQPLIMNEPDFDPDSLPDAPKRSFEGLMPEPDISDFGKTDFHVPDLMEEGLEVGAAPEPPLVRLDEASEGMRDDSVAEAAVAVPLAPGPPLEPSNSAVSSPSIGGVHSGVPQVNAAQLFILPIRIKTLTGTREVQLKVNIGVELSGEKIEDISAVEIFKPLAREPYSPPPYRSSERQAITADERPHRAPIKPKAEPKDKDKEKKPSMLQKIFLGKK